MNNDLPISLLLTAFTGALMLLLPHLSPLRYFFAITVPAGFRSTSAARASLHRYYAVVICSVIIGVAGVIQSVRLLPRFAPMEAMLIPSILSAVAYLWERAYVARHVTPDDSIRSAEIQTEDDRLPGWIALVLPPFGVLLAVAAWLRSRWNEIPARFPVHWGIDNQPDRWVDKSARAIYGPVLFAAGMILVMILLTLALFYGSRRGRQRTANLKMMVVVLYFLAIVFSCVSVMPVVHVSPLMMLVPGILFPIGLLVWVIKVVRDPQMPVETTPDRCWYLGSIYVNADDPAIFVQKRIGFGYTINMGNRLAWVLMGVFVAAIVALVFLLP